MRVRSILEHASVVLIEAWPARPVPLASSVQDDPACTALLHVLQGQIGKLVTPQTTSDQDAEHDAIALAF